MHQQTITVKETFIVPDGYKLTGEKRPPKKGEYFLRASNGAAICANIDFVKDSFYILEKVVTPAMQMKHCLDVCLLDELEAGTLRIVSVLPGAQYQDGLGSVMIEYVRATPMPKAINTGD